MNTVAASHDGDLMRAYARCAKLAREHYENFPVASLLLPPRMRPHIAAIYAFARAADDFADEPGISDPERFRLLEGWHTRLHAADNRSGTVQRSRDPDGAPHEDEDIFLALHDTIRERQLPLSLFDDLLSAFRQDITTKRYATWADLLDYCRRSANPVGRLVLRVAGCNDAELDAASDAVCTALQLTNFWQDLDRDWAKGRLYVPLEERDTAGAREEDLDRRRMTPEWRTAMRAVTLRTREFFTRGRAVCDRVPGRLKWELRLTWLGGSRILDRLERTDFDVFHRRPALGAADVPAILWHAARWKRPRHPQPVATVDS